MKTLAITRIILFVFFNIDCLITCYTFTITY